MIVLGIDSASRNGSIAVARGGSDDWTAALPERTGHARDLLREIEALLGRAGLKASSLDAIGVALGPGSFTGLRVGLATAKGLGYALGIEVAGLSTLEATAQAAVPRLRLGDPVCAVLEAGRGELYTATFRLEAEGLRRLSEDRARRLDQVGAGIADGTLLAGDGAASLRTAGFLKESQRVLEDLPPLAPILAAHAGRTTSAGSGYRPGLLRPNYIRPSDAEVSRRKP